MLGRIVAVGLVALFAQGASVLASEKREEFVFDTYVSGLKVGVVRFNAVEAGSNYALAGNMNTAGLVGFFHKMAYEATAQGTVRGNRFSPSKYTESGYSGRWATDVVVEWRRGTPAMTRHEPPLEPQPHHADPAKERGSIDTLTALYATLRSLPPDQVCTGSWQLFDGRQGATLTLRSPTKAGDQVECTGEYRRRSGFTAEELASRTAFPFAITYGPAGDGRMRVVELRTASTMGNVRMVRR